LGVYYKDNTLNNWVSISENLPNVKVSDMEINSNDNILTISTYGRGIWQTPIPPVSRPSHDLDLLDINTQIDSDYRCHNLLNASIKVYNNGTAPITSFSYESSLNNVSQGLDNWTGNLAAGEVLNLPLNIQNNSIIGTNSLRVDLSYQNETVVVNNSMNREFESDNPPNYDGQSNTTYTFEATEDDWIVVGDALWEKGIPGGDDLNQVISGTNVYATNLSGNYPENSNSKLVSPCFDLSTLESGSIKFYIGYNLETGYDYLYFDYSVNGGVDWTNIETFNGADTTLKLKEYSLSQEMLAANIIFRFNIITDEIVHEEGAVIDDFIVEGTSLSFTNDFDQYVSIFPNPTRDVFTINTADSFQINNISIFNLDSKLVYDIKSIKNSTHVIDFKNQSRGLYFVEFTTTDGYKIIRKLLVE
ncbi:MAG: T9SS type A sorting domain-containing protein, partial [Flavobacteriales bacterium]|nr:T9SS type A sorting domain-containing protein [Flavobacteriales bacterium]